MTRGSETSLLISKFFKEDKLDRKGGKPPLRKCWGSGAKGRTVLGRPSRLVLN